MTDTPVDPYYMANARRVLKNARGNSGNPKHLAAWAQDIARTDTTNRGVLITADGTIVGRTLHMEGRVGGWYVTEPVVSPNEIGGVMASMAEEHGSLIHVTYRDVATMSGLNRVGSF